MLLFQYNMTFFKFQMIKNNFNISVVRIIFLYLDQNQKINPSMILIQTLITWGGGLLIFELILFNKVISSIYAL
jgi:hypothetical protein